MTDKNNNKLSEALLDTVIGKYKVGSLLNIPFGVSQKKEVFAEVITQIQKKSLEEIGIPCIYGLDQIHGASYDSKEGDDGWRGGCAAINARVGIYEGLGGGGRMSDILFENIQIENLYGGRPIAVEIVSDGTDTGLSLIHISEPTRP